MAQLRIRVDLSMVKNQASTLLHGMVLQRLSQAVEHVAQNTATMWQTAIHKAKLWSGERDAYASTVQWKMISPMKAEVWSDYKQAQEIETGRPAYDLKRMLDTSLKTRTSKTGRRYLIIPFRHNTPGYTAHANDMPAHVHDMAKKLTFSKVTGMGVRPFGPGASDIKTKKGLTVPQAKYFWGGRLAPGSMGPNPKGRTDRFAGMVRFQDTSTQGQKRSVYMTFRVMAEGSPGWVIPPRPGLFIAKTVIDAMQPVAQQEFLNAVQGHVL